MNSPAYGRTLLRSHDKNIDSIRATAASGSVDGDRSTVLAQMVDTIGDPFWNENGIPLTHRPLLEVIRSAPRRNFSLQHFACTMYVNVVLPNIRRRNCLDDANGCF